MRNLFVPREARPSSPLIPDSTPFFAYLIWAVAFLFAVLAVSLLFATFAK
jgi:hypothetical protein